MQIKEVEEKTGLTAKSIRFYEEKGLLKVARSENGYRDYSKENVGRLRRIRLLRYLGFSIQEMSELFEDAEHRWNDVLIRKAQELTNERDLTGTKIDLCHSLMEDGFDDDTIEEYNETIDYIESDDYADFKESVLSVVCASLSRVIIDTIVFLAPIVMLFFYIVEEDTERILRAAIVSLISAVTIALIWSHYLRTRKEHREMQIKKNKSNRWMPLLCVVAILACFALLIGISVGAEWLIAPKGWLFYNMRPWAELLMIVSMCLLVINLVFWIMNRGKQAEREQETPFLYGVFQSHPLMMTFVWLGLMAFALLHVTYVTEDSIVDFSILHPRGKVYTYDEIEKVDVSFGKKSISLLDYKRKGQFSYTIYLDGKKRVFHTPSTNGAITRYEEDSYLELEEFDAKLMALGIPKTSDETYWKRCDLEQVYVDRFRRIAANQ